MKINFNTKTIEMTKTEAKAAGRIGSEKFNELKEIRNFYRDYEIKIVKTKKSKSSTAKVFKGFTYEFMEAYIENHDNEKKSTMATYNSKRGKVEGFTVAPESFANVREWFIETYKDTFTEQYKAVEEARKNRKAA